MAASPDLIFRHSDGLIKAEIDVERLCLHIENGMGYGFSLSPTRIRAPIEEQQVVAALCEAQSAEFEVEPADARPDVIALVEVLRQDGLATRTPA